MDGPQFAISLLTVVMSGVVAATVNFSLARSREEEVIYRQKLEDFHSEATAYMKAIYDRATKAILVLGTPEHAAIVEHTPEEDPVLPEWFDNEVNTCLSNLQMLVAVYHPDFHDWLNKLMAVSTALSDHIRELRDSGGDPTGSTQNEDGEEINFGMIAGSISSLGHELTSLTRRASRKVNRIASFLDT